MFSSFGPRDNAAVRAKMEEIRESITNLKKGRLYERDEKLRKLESLSPERKETVKKALYSMYEYDEIELCSLQNELNSFQKILDDRAVPSLQQCAETAAFKSLGEVADKLCNPFCCGGRLDGQNILLHYKSKEIRELREIRLPGAENEALAQLLSAGSVASFGKGSEQVTDLTYRNAFKLGPDEMTTSFHPGSTSILSEIETILVPNRSIRAELHKLNMYTGPGGHLKSHVDTPHSEDMFGSLVVCLPTQFTGGALVTRHKGEEKVFDWFSSPEDTLNEVCWAAFFSDVEHEILPVTSGHRLTLTYNLYFVNESRNISTSNVGRFHTAFKEALYTPHFLRNGGCLGFDCKHAYVFTSLNKVELLPHLLKGADYAVFSTAKALGLNVSVKPIMEGEKSWYVLPKFSQEVGLYLSEGEGDFGRLYDECRCYSLQKESLEWELCDAVYDKTPKKIPSRDISWCSQPNHWNRSLFGMYTFYGNEAADIELCYQSAVILVELPAWGEAPRTLLASRSVSNPAPKAELKSDITKVESRLDPKAKSDQPWLETEIRKSETDNESDPTSEMESVSMPEAENKSESEFEFKVFSEDEPPRKKQKIGEGIINSQDIFSWRKKNPEWEYRP